MKLNGGNYATVKRVSPQSSSLRGKMLAKFIRRGFSEITSINVFTRRTAIAIKKTTLFQKIQAQGGWVGVAHYGKNKGST